jgi:hypothetical protein
MRIQIQIRIEVKSWIRIRFKVMRIHNPEENYRLYENFLTSLLRLWSCTYQLTAVLNWERPSGLDCSGKHLMFPHL